MKKVEYPDDHLRKMYKALYSLYLYETVVCLVRQPVKVALPSNAHFVVCEAVA